MKAIIPSFSYPLNDNLFPQLHDAMDREHSLQKSFDPVAKFFSNSIKQQPCVETSFWNLISEKEKGHKVIRETSLSEIFKESRKSFNSDASIIFSHKDQNESSQLSSSCSETLGEPTCCSNLWGDINQNNFWDHETINTLKQLSNNNIIENGSEFNSSLTEKKIQLKNTKEKFNTTLKKTLEKKIESDKKSDSLNDDPTLWNCVAKRIQYRKTKRCPWFSKGKCWLNDQCNYAHDDNELHDRPDLSCTRICTQGFKCRDVKCRFAHSYTELRSTDVFFRTKLCKYWASGAKCPCGVHCRHAHGLHQLRRIQLDASHDTTQPCQSLINRDQSVKNSKCVMSPFFLFSSLTSSQSNQMTVPFFKYSLNDCYERKKTGSVSIPIRPILESDSVCKPPVHLLEASSKSSTCISLKKANKSFSLLENKSVDILSPTQPEHDMSPSKALSQYDPITGFPAKSWVNFNSPTMGKDKNNSNKLSRHSIIHLNDILDLAVASSDPELLESSARVLRASLRLKTFNHGEFNKICSSNNQLVAAAQPN